ncbi:MAG TPA: Lrp/AsnC family transcriptional regulator [Candidatus Nanoarchaeia archaeon]|nr:Lrp/AsnC family transcriptional regulator [Candidatus Nanoarchaeia archaeon]
MACKEDLAVLKHLRKDARITKTAIGDKLNMPISSVQGRFARLKGSVIKKFTSSLDYTKLGFKFRSLYHFSLKKKSGEMLANPNVNNAYRTGKNTFLAECIFSSLNEMHSFYESLEKLGARKIEYHLIIEELKFEEMPPYTHGQI